MENSNNGHSDDESEDVEDAGKDRVVVEIARMDSTSSGVPDQLDARKRVAVVTEPTEHLNKRKKGTGDDTNGDRDHHHRTKGKNDPSRDFSSAIKTKSSSKPKNGFRHRKATPKTTNRSGFCLGTTPPIFTFRGGLHDRWGCDNNNTRSSSEYSRVVFSHPPCIKSSPDRGWEPNYTGYIQEPHMKPVYCVTWSTDYHNNDYDTIETHRYVDVLRTTESNPKPKEPQSLSRYLATCGGNSATIYEVPLVDDNPYPRGGVVSKSFVLKQSFVVNDCEEPVEELNACAFCGRSKLSDNNSTVVTSSPQQDSSRSDDDQSQLLCDISMPQLLCVGGTQRRISVFDTIRRERVMILNGHGGDILDLKACPNDQWLLASASADESIRLWNLTIGAPIAILAGTHGHRDLVISISWHPTGNRIASAGMDTTVKVWDTGDGSLVRRAIADSRETATRLQTTGELYLKPTQVEVPLFSTSKVHLHCVDSVHFVGNLILSKSIDSVIELWSPVLTTPEVVTGTASVITPLDNDIVHLRSFRYSGGDKWFMRFAVDPSQKRLAVGNRLGKVFVWNIDGKSSGASHVLSLNGGTMSSIVRGLEFSPCGNVLVASMEDGSVHKWDVRNNAKV
jgi:WD40 repeat protein